MTDNPLVEAVAKAMAPSNWQPFDPKIHGSPVNQKAAQVMWLSQATAALRAIEDAGYKIIIGTAAQPDKPTP